MKTANRQFLSRRNHPQAILLLMSAALGSASCSGSGGGDVIPGGGGGDNVDAAPIGGEHTLQSIVVTPTNPIVQVDLGAASTQAFVATGYYADNVNEDLTDRVAWAAQNAEVGVMSGSILLIPAFSTTDARVSKITAKLGDLRGSAQITVVAYELSGATPDFFFVLPFQDPTGNQDKPLSFSTDVPAADVFFLMDVTGSMGGEISNLKSALTSTVVPGIVAQIPDTQFGAGASADFPVSPYGSLTPSSTCLGAGSNPDQPFQLFQGITPNVSSVNNAVGRFSSFFGSPIGCGQDFPEANIEALYQVATGTGLAGPGATNVPANHSGMGGVGFRSGTMPVVVQITDAMSHAPGEAVVCPDAATNNSYAGAVLAAAHSRQATKEALSTLCARVVGITPITPGLSAVCTSQPDLEDFARATNARVPPQAWDVPARPVGCAAGQCCTDFNGSGRAPDASGLCPLVFRVDENGSGLGTHVVTGIKMLTRFATFSVGTEKSGETMGLSGEPLPSGTSTADFIKALTPESFTLPPAPPTLPDPTFDAIQFQEVTPGTQVDFRLTAFNDFVPETEAAQFFRVKIRVLAGGCTDLDERDVLILVPPTPIGID